MKLRLLTIATFLSILSSACAFAQHSAVSASLVKDANGGVLTTGSLCARTVDATNKPIVAFAGGPGGVVVDGDACAPVTNGAVSGFNPLDTSISRPLNVCLRITVKNASGSPLRSLPCVQMSSSWCSAGSLGFANCNFDSYNPNLTPLALVQTGPQGVQGPPGGPNTTATRLTAGTDLNTIVSCGYYDVNSPANGPSVWSSVFIKVQVVCAADPNFTTQIAYDMIRATNTSYIRNQTFGTWHPWHLTAIPSGGGDFLWGTHGPCSITGPGGSATSGVFLSGTNGTCTFDVVMGGGLSAGGWSCYGSNISHPANVVTSFGTATSATLSVPTTAGDEVVFHCDPF